MSFLIAIRNLFGEKSRLIVTVGGVAFAVTLILVLIGLYQGWNKQMTKFLGGIKTDFWLAQKGTRDISHSVSILPANIEKSIIEINSVERVIPFIGRQIGFEIAGKEAHLFLVGADQTDTIQAPKIIQGKGRPGRGEIVLDQAFVKNKNLKIGDELEIKNKRLKVVGIADGGNLLVYTYGLANLADVREIFDFADFVNYYLIQSNDPQKTEENLKEKFSDFQINKKQEFLDQSASVIKETFLPIIGILVVLAFFVGIAVIGLTIFTATIEKSREFGVLKAIGYSNRQLFTIAIIQSLVSGLIGFFVGNLIVIFVVKLAMMKTSSFIYAISFQEIAAVFVTTILMSVLAAFIPLRRIIAIDPATVFKA